MENRCNAMGEIITEGENERNASTTSWKLTKGLSRDEIIATAIKALLEP
jgi:hypothetical protein